MKKVEELKYKVEMNVETMRDVKDLIYFCRDHFPFTKNTLWNLCRELSNIIQDGCFKHNRLRKEFRTGTNSTESICPKCSPKRYTELRKDFKEE